ncbi:hypothetical protein ABMA10_00605 [Plantibacter sp. RU18]
MVIRFGRPTPWRGIIIGLIFGVGIVLVGSVFSLVDSHPERTPLMLMFLGIPAVLTPVLIGSSGELVIYPGTVHRLAGEPRRSSQFRGRPTQVAEASITPMRGTFCLGDMGEARNRG